jgi:hypothetical protein
MTRSTLRIGTGKVVDYLHPTNDVLTARSVHLPLEGQPTTRSSP